MEIRVRRLILVAALMFFCCQAFAQPYKRLTVNDFKGAPSNNGDGAIAYTNCTIEYSYTARPEKDYYVLTFYIKLIMNSDRSWMNLSKIGSREMLEEILKHEQGHYNISYMEQQELLRTVGRTVFRSDYHRVADNIFDRIEAKYKQLNQNYDTDTQNSTNRVQQHSWDAYFQQRLNYMPIAKN
ncbi:DUF922 domain-containing protein [Mucilaginibacter gotjawali]|uniref:DUF922 domain-containing protein n=1 Tax=Mucilaginibacter gotjawali TaxID=1550579 RepID=A0A839S9K2_9SPHI|nr:hypothetical protein [Mucilaginibacter gotjawali]MBB3054506.1 hypothetical protein [Mucilaginibacter gotjawali]